LSKFSRMNIPKSEEDVKKISEEIMQQESQNIEVETEESEVHSHKEVDLSIVAHELTHIQELLLHVIHVIRELRDSVDNLNVTIRKSLRALALLQVVNSMSDTELKFKLLEQVSKDLGIELKKHE